MAGWRERTQRDAEPGLLAVRRPYHDGALAHPPAQEGYRRLGAEVGGAARARVVGVDVRDDGALGRSPGVDVEAARGTEKAHRRRHDKIGDSSILPPRGGGPKALLFGECPAASGSPSSSPRA